MMQSQFKVFLPLLFLSAVGAKAQTFEWGGRFGGIGEDVVREMTADAAGNVYTTGYYTDSADFNIGAGTYMMTSAGFYDVFIQKTDASGQFLWARSFGGANFDYGTGVATDAQGNVYVTGVFQDSPDFDPGAGTAILTSNGAEDIFVVKLDASGHFIWARSFGSPVYDESQAIGVDDAGNVYITGYFNETADFDPGPGTFELTSAGFNDNFVVKLDAAGNLVWAKRFGNEEVDVALAMKVTGNGDQYITGIFRGTVDFDPGPGEAPVSVSGSSPGGFLLKLDAAGDFQMARQISGTGGVVSYDIDLDAAGNIYLTGTFEETVDFDPGAGTFEMTALAYENGFITKLGAAGELVWARQLSSMETLIPYSISVDPSGHVYTSGYFENTADFNPDPAVEFELVPGPNNAMGAFLSHLDAQGNFVSAYEFGGVNYADYHGVATDGQGNVYLSGAFENTVDINPDPSPAMLDEVVAMEFRDNYLIKLRRGFASVQESENTGMTLFPNPTSDAAVLQADGAWIGGGYTVYDQAGRRLSGGTLTSAQTRVDVSAFPKGMYFVHLPGNRVIKLVKQ